MKEIVGHHKQKNLLSKFLCGKKLHHGFLFCGPEHVGKMVIAQAFSRALVSAQDIDWSIDETMDSDMTIVAPIREEKKNKVVYKDISIDQINEARRSFALAPDKKAKVLIVNDADRLTISAQNALLKTLEEPQKNRFIVLVAHRSDQLLDTIISRCFTITFSLVDDRDLTAQTQDLQHIDDAQGRPGYFHRLVHDEEFRETVVYAREKLRSLSRMTMGERMQLATELSKRDEKYLQDFFCVWIYRIRMAAIDTHKFHLLKVADRTESLLFSLQDTNVNKQLIIEDFLIHIA